MHSASLPGIPFKSFTGLYKTCKETNEKTNDNTLLDNALRPNDKTCPHFFTFDAYEIIKGATAAAPVLFAKHVFVLKH